MLLIRFGIFFGIWNIAFSQTRENASSGYDHRNPKWSQFFYFGPGSEHSPPNGFFYQIGNRDLIKRIDNNFNFGPYEDFENPHYFGGFFSKPPMNSRHPNLFPRFQTRPGLGHPAHRDFRHPGPDWFHQHFDPEQFSHSSGFKPLPEPNYYHVPSSPRRSNPGHHFQRPTTSRPFLYHPSNYGENANSFLQDTDVNTPQQEGKPNTLNGGPPFPYFHNRPPNNPPKNESLKDSEARQGAYSLNNNEPTVFIHRNVSPPLQDGGNFPSSISLGNINDSNNNNPGQSQRINNGVYSYFLPPGTSHHPSLRQQNTVNSNLFSNQGFFPVAPIPPSHRSSPRYRAAGPYGLRISPNGPADYPNSSFDPPFINTTRNFGYPSENDNYNPYLPYHSNGFHPPSFRQNYASNSPYPNDIYDPFNPYIRSPFGYQPPNSPTDPYNINDDEASKVKQNNRTENPSLVAKDKIISPSPEKEEEEEREILEVVTIDPTRASRRKPISKVPDSTTPASSITKRLRRTSLRPTQPASFITKASRNGTRRARRRKMKATTEINSEIKEESSTPYVNATTSSPESLPKNVSRRNLRKKPPNINALLSPKRTTPIKTPISPPTNAETISSTEPLKINS